MVSHISLKLILGCIFTFIGGTLFWHKAEATINGIFTIKIKEEPQDKNFYLFALTSSEVFYI